MLSGRALAGQARSSEFDFQQLSVFFTLLIMVSAEHTNTKECFVLYSDTQKWMNKQYKQASTSACMLWRQWCSNYKT